MWAGLTAHGEEGARKKMKKRAFWACVAAVAAVTAGAHVLDEATYFWRFDRDVNGDGSLQATELRDVRHWGSTNVNGYAGTPVSATIYGNGLTNGPYWVTDTVLSAYAAPSSTVKSKVRSSGRV